MCSPTGTRCTTDTLSRYITRHASSKQREPLTILRAVSQVLESKALPAALASLAQIDISPQRSYLTANAASKPHPFTLPGSLVKVCPLTSVNSKSDILLDTTTNIVCRLSHPGQGIFSYKLGQQQRVTGTSSPQTVVLMPEPDLTILSVAPAMVTVMNANADPTDLFPCLARLAICSDDAKRLASRTESCAWESAPLLHQFK